MSGDTSQIRFLPCGDSAVVVEFGNVIDREINGAVRDFCDKASNAGAGFILELVPTYRSAMVYYDPARISWDGLLSYLRPLALESKARESGKQRLVTVPVCYGGEFGPDLQFVSIHTGLTPDEVIEIHSGGVYFVYMLGFTPGYPYMGGMDPRLSTPRLGTPRLKTPEGSVGIAGTQTGIYSLESPGGWRIIGRTPLRLFDPKGSAPFLLDSGCLVKFKPVSGDEYFAIAGEVRHGH